MTHLVVVPEATEAALHAEYPNLPERPDSVTVVTDMWVCDSLVHGRRQPEKDYTWHSAKQPLEEPPATPPAVPSKRSAGFDLQTPEAKRFRSSRTEASRERSKMDPATSIGHTGKTAKRFTFMDGDWNCPNCGHHNFRKRRTCWRLNCGCPRPDDDRGDAAKQQAAGHGPEVVLPGSGAVTGGARSPEAVRDLIEEEFRTCADAWAARGDKWRSWQYKKAELLIKQAVGISREDLGQLGLTPKFVQKCEEIQQQGFLEQAAHFRSDPDMRALLELTRIHGVGEKLAHRWLRLGVRSLDDVRSKKDALPSSPGGPPTGLSKQQRLALQFVDDIQLKICRAEAERFEAEVNRHIKALSMPALVVPCGSYRTGDDLLPSVILVVCVGAGAAINEESERLLESLRNGLVVADLSCGAMEESWTRTVVRPAGGEPPYARVFLGVAQGLPGPGETARFRRMDLVFCSREALPFATIQWTGNDGGIFNRELKRIAAFRGLHLSTTFVCQADREGAHGRNVGNVCRTGPCIPCADESAVFAALGLPYRPPERRRVDAEMLAAVEEAAAAVPAYRLAVRADLDRAVASGRAAKE